MLKKIVFLGTGGTIAGTAAHAGDNVGYTAAQVGVGQLLRAIPSLQQALGDQGFMSEQVAQVDSKDMGWAHWRNLAQRIQHHLSQPAVDSVVVAHGTDTLEETAFFLSLVLPQQLLVEKSVVLTCAMRPASSLAPDGPQNVLDAVAVARSADLHGVLVVCAGSVHCARDVQKVHPYRLNAFDSGDAGPLAYVEEGWVRRLHAYPAMEMPVSDFSIDALSKDAWPRVEIITSYAGATGATVRALCAAPGGTEQPVQGIVVAGTGNGTIHEDLESALREVQARGVRVVRSTRCAYGSVVVGAVDSDFPDSQGLSPVKARIALMLELMS
nr:asparaginase [Rhodoferax sp.]